MLNSFLLEIKKEYQTNMEGRWREYVICVEKSQIWKVLAESKELEPVSKRTAA